MAAATRSIVINAPVDACFAVIADVERYPEFLPEVKKIKTSNRKGNEVDAQYEADFKVKIIKYTVRLKEEKPNKLSWTYVDGEFMKDNHGGWVLEAQGDQTKATYSITVEVSRLVPNSVVTMLTESQLPTLLENFKKRIESRK